MHGTGWNKQSLKSMMIKKAKFSFNFYLILFILLSILLIKRTKCKDVRRKLPAWSLYCVMTRRCLVFILLLSHCVWIMSSSWLGCSYWSTNFNLIYFRQMLLLLDINCYSENSINYCKKNNFLNIFDFKKVRNNFLRAFAVPSVLYNCKYCK